MDESRFHRIEELFQRAADLPSSERPAFLEAECAGDDALRARVEALLLRLEGGGSLAPPELPADLPGVERAGDLIDRYKLLEPIGEGGFGVVWMAEQQQPVRRKVALKVIKLGMDSAEVVARFEAERQALALMDHPGIASVLDGGATATGRPYFVMELVNGVAITEYCDGNALPTAERLALFGEVCRAVQHAHQKGVIHRDLKPGNVLVTVLDGRPVPKVIDFGIAKAIDQRLTERTLFTRFQRFVGTPQYMSPEQAGLSALDVDTRSDIYSLGVLLYELLTGAPPIAAESLREAGLAEMQRVIREELPPRPSLRVSTGADAQVARQRGVDLPTLGRLLRGDLDWIVMKALEKERARRYETASALAEDVARHLAHEPVLAGPPGNVYRLRKALQRNRGAVITLGLLLAALSVGLVSTLIALREVNIQRELAEDARHQAVTQSQAASAARLEAEARRAQAELAAELEAAERRRAEDGLAFFVETLSLADPEVALQADLTVRELLDRTAVRLPAVLGHEPSLEQPLRATIGRAYASMGEYALAEQHLRRAVELLDGDPDADALELFGLRWMLTDAAFRVEAPDAWPIAKAAQDLGIALLGEHAPALGAAYREFLDLIDGGEDWERAPALFERCVALEQQHLRPGEPLRRVASELDMAAGYTLWYTPSESMSEAFFRRALEIKQEDLPPNHPDVAEALAQLVGVMTRAGRPQEAEALMRRSLDLLREVLPEDSWAVSLAKARLGQALMDQQRWAEAEALLLESSAVVVDRTGPSAFFAVEALARLVQLYDGWGKPIEAAPHRARLTRAVADGMVLLEWPMTRHVFTDVPPGRVPGAAADITPDVAHDHAHDAVGDTSPAVPARLSLRGLMGALDQAGGGGDYTTAAGHVAGAEVPALFDELLARRDEWGDDPDRALVVARFLRHWATSLDPTGPAAAARARMVVQARTLLEPHAGRVPLDAGEALVMQASLPGVAGGRPAVEALARAGAALMVHVEGVNVLLADKARVRAGRLLLALELPGEAEPLLTPSAERMRALLAPAPGAQLAPVPREVLDARELAERARAALRADGSSGG